LEQKKWYAKIAWLYGKNYPTICEVIKIKKFRAGFYVAPQNTNVTAKASDKYLMKFEKALKICVEYKHTKRVPVDDNMLRQIALILYWVFQKEDGTEEETSPFTTGRGRLHRFRNRFNLKNFKIIEQAKSAAEETAATFQTELKNYQGGNYDHRHVFNCDETGLFWKKIPKMTYILKSAK
jgi:hypothetical protein